MPESWNRLRTTALDSTNTLSEILSDPECDDRRLVTGYLEAKHALANAFEAFAIEKYTEPSIFDIVKDSLERVMRETYPHIPSRYLRVRGYGSTHRLLLAYIVGRAGKDIDASELRMLTGDAVHTERRARELRDLGFRLDARHTQGADVYVLTELEADFKFGARALIAKNIREDRTITKSEASDLLESLGG